MAYQRERFDVMARAAARQQQVFARGGGFDEQPLERGMPLELLLRRDAHVEEAAQRDFRVFGGCVARFDKLHRRAVERRDEAGHFRAQAAAFERINRPAAREPRAAAGADRFRRALRGQIDLRPLLQKRIGHAAGERQRA